MQKLLLLVALVALAVAEKRIQVKHRAEARVTDMDRMNYDGLFGLEQSHPEALSETVHADDVAHFFEASIGADWKNYVDYDESEPISYLELIRLSTSVTMLNNERVRVARNARGEDGDHLEVGHEAQANICMCHGTYHSSFHTAEGGESDARGSWPFRGVRVLQKGGSYYGNNPYPKGVPQDCVLCEGLTNCQACCHGPCTIGTPADFTAARDGAADWKLGLYPCPTAWTFSGDDDAELINDISDCTVTVDTCSDALALCDCAQKRRLIQTFQCDCLDVMRLCNDCFQAWDAIDRFKRCDCVDYARYYQQVPGSSS